MAERYGYVNRALPDAELDQFVDALARRIAGFDKQAIADIKRLVDIPTLPSDIEIGAEWDAFLASAHRPQAQQNLERLTGFRPSGPRSMRWRSRGAADE